MDKIKEINEFDSILDYYKYLEESLKELTEKVNNTTSKKLKGFYSEQLDIAIKNRNSIRSVVFAKKNKILHDKLSNIKEQQVNDFIKSKKEEKLQLSKKKLDLELQLSFYESFSDFSKNFMEPIAQEASNYSCSDFYVSDKDFNKFYLFKDDDNNVGEYTGLMILSKYLKGNFSVLNKITKRHEIKEKYLNKYINELKEQYPDYSIEEITKLANDNLISHSPELMETINQKYDFTADEYKALANAYSSFDNDCKYIANIDINDEKKSLNNINAEISCISNISDSTNIEDYILKEFDNKRAKIQMFKTATETLESDNNIAKYINKNNLLKGFELSPETKAVYSEQLKEQNKLLDSIKLAENNIIQNEDTIKVSQAFLKKLKNSKDSIMDIGNSEKAIKDIRIIIENYNSNFVLPLNTAKQDYENFKNSQELALVPYQKVGFFKKIAGIFNGKNKIQKEFDNKCREYEANIKVLAQKAALNKPDYNFTNDNDYMKAIGHSIKEYIFKHPDCSEYSAGQRVLNSYTTDLNDKLYTFKEANMNSINELDDCYSYTDISNCISSAIEKVKEQINTEKNKQQVLSINKTFLCSKYNENSSMPISPVATYIQIQNTQNEISNQLQKIDNYKGENEEVLKYKIQVENLLDNDTSFLSDAELKDLDNSAQKTAESIIKDAANNFINKK